MVNLPDDLPGFAEDPAAFAPLEVGQERVEDPRFVVLVSPGRHVWSSVVGRLRLEPDGVEGAVAEVRTTLSERGRTSAVWSVGSSATPGGLFDRLLALGLTAEPDPESLVQVLSEPPRVRPAKFEVRWAHTPADFRAATEVMIEGFGFTPEDAAEERSSAARTFESQREAGHTRLMVAVDGGRPVAAGRAQFTPWGAYLTGGATLPSDRGRGAMSSLIVAAWEEAGRRNTPALVTHGGGMSAPILSRIGFREIARVTHLIDRFARGM